MVDDPLQRKFAADASLFAQMADLAHDHILVSLLSEADYRAASFLDQRIFSDHIQREWMAWDALPTLTNTAPADYIFHIGHVGSTLMSRLLTEAGDVLPVREPLLLRTLAQISALKGRPDASWSPDQLDRRLAQVSGWLSRSFRSEQKVMVKATSFVTAIADQLLAPLARALFLYVPLDRYLETILAGEASLNETLAQAPDRIARLDRLFPHTGLELWKLPVVTRVAMSWLCEMATAQIRLPAADPRHLWLDFEAFLVQPEKVLGTLCQHFGLAPDTALLRQIIAGPIMQQYSKAPEHGYSPDLRRQLQQQSAAQYAPAITEAVAWVEAFAAHSKSLSTLPLRSR